MKNVDDAQLQQIIEKALLLKRRQGNRTLSQDELNSIGRELDLEPELLQEASAELDREQKRKKNRGQAYKWILVALLGMFVFVAGGTYALRSRLEHRQDRYNVFFEKQITLVNDAVSYLDEANQAALDEHIAAFHQAGTTREKITQMIQINAGLDTAIFFKKRIGDARAEAILAANRELKTRFFFASH